MNEVIEKIKLFYLNNKYILFAYLIIISKTKLGE